MAKKKLKANPKKSLVKENESKLESTVVDHFLRWVQTDSDGRIIIEFDGRRHYLTEGQEIKI